MAVIAKNYLDFTGLSAYDGLIKAYVDAGDAKAIKTVLWDSTNEQIKFYKKENATLSDTADYSVEISSQDVEDLKTRVGMSSTLNGYNSATNLTDIMNILTGNALTTGSVAKALADAESYTDDAIAGLDVDEFALATNTNGVVTIKGIKEVNGEIAVGTTTTNDVTLAKVATSGDAEDVATAAIDDGETEPTQLYPAGTVQGTLEAIARDLNSLENESVVTVEKDTTAQEGYFASYTIKQNNQQVGVKINIPKDYLVKSGQVKTVTVADEPYPGAVVGDKYLDFVVNTRDASVTDEHIYIPVKDLTDVYTGGTTAEATVAIDSSNEITVTINTIAASKISYDNGGTTTTVQAIVSTINGDNTTTGSFRKEVTDAKSEVIGQNGDAASANTIYGAKAYADGKVADLDGSAGIASVSGDVITIKGGVTEANGVVSNSTADDVTISPIASSDIAGLFS